MKKLIALLVSFVLGSNLTTLAQSQGAPEATKSASRSQNIAGATKQNPFENSLGMRFVPVPGTNVLFSIWDTRVQDYRVYGMANSKVDLTCISPGFEQGEDHPVVHVNWVESKAFCTWLTQKERKEGGIGQDQEYRLPTDKEWSAAVGESEYPWGNDWPPPKGAGNYYVSLKVDDYQYTSPVGTFSANEYGLYDMGGNVYQWCEDWYRSEMNTELFTKYPAYKDAYMPKNKFRVYRGSSWSLVAPGWLLSSARGSARPDKCQQGFIGFRCVLASSLSPR